MSKLIAVMGESGSGKTTSMRNLDPAATYYIDCDKKGLSWRGWREQFSKEKKNLLVTRDLQKIQIAIKAISDQCPHIKTIVIDTLNTCMVDKEVKGMKETGYGKWTDLTQFVWDVCETAASLRDDLFVVILFHSETVRDDYGYSFTRIKTNGRKLEKVILESLFGTVFYAKTTDDGRHIFETRAKNSTAKTPMGAFDAFEIDNDMAAILKTLEEF